MPQYWLDLPIGAQRVLEDAAERCDMAYQGFLTMLLVEAADVVLTIEPERRYWELKKLTSSDCEPEESNKDTLTAFTVTSGCGHEDSAQGGTIEEDISSSRRHRTRSARSRALGAGAPCRTQKKSAVGEACLSIPTAPND